MIIPIELAEAVEREAAAIDPRAMAAAAQALTEKYREGQLMRRGAPLADDALLAAYAVVRLPATFAAAGAALAALAERAPGLAPRSLLDLGAGLGAAAWAAGEVFPTLERATLLERDPAAIAMGRRMMEGATFDGLNQADWRAGDLINSALNPAAHDLIILSYALGEVPAIVRPRILSMAWAAASQAMVIVEPGTPAGFGVVAAARTALIATGGAVTAPCPHDAACPLQSGPAWCHFAQRLARSRRHRLAKGGDLGWEDEKYSYVAVVKDRALMASGAGARIITTPHVSKGGVELEVCAAGGIEKRAIPRRDAAAYKRAKKSAWGDWWQE